MTWWRRTPASTRARPATVTAASPKCPPTSAWRPWATAEVSSARTQQRVANTASSSALYAIFEMWRVPPPPSFGSTESNCTVTFCLITCHVVRNRTVRKTHSDQKRKKKKEKEKKEKKGGRGGGGGRRKRRNKGFFVSMCFTNRS